MKLDIDGMQKLFKTVDNAQNIVKDDDGKVVSFDYKKVYDNKSTRIIKVSVKKKRVNSNIYQEIDEAVFFGQLADNVKEVTDVRMSGDKIVKYTLNGKKYKTSKLDFPKLFDFIDFQSFYKVVKERFYTDDDILRNGYFTGLIGTSDSGLREYKESAEEYDLFDVDFNSAYPYCFKFPLPFGRFYEETEWQAVKDDFPSFTKFYEIKLRCIKNDFDVFIPVLPYVEYSDFDFLLSRQTSSLVVSAERLALIDIVYGSDAYIIRKTYYCATKKYLKLSRFVDEMFDNLAKAKADGDEGLVTAMKIAFNSLVGRFGKRDERRQIDKLYLSTNSFATDSINIDWLKEEYTCLNYLPIAIMINDITARRLFDLLTNEKCIRICYNTDGGIVAVKKGIQIENSKRIGMLKTKKIEKPLFYSCTFIYNRPIVYDFATDKVFNSNAISYNAEDDEFYFSERHNINCREGFKTVDSSFSIKVEKYKSFNFRESEILLKIQDTELYKRLKSTPELQSDDFSIEVLKPCAYTLEKLLNPFDSFYNSKIKYKPERVYEYEQICIDKNFFK